MRDIKFPICKRSSCDYVFQITVHMFNYVVSDCGTELKTKKVSSSRALYSIMFVKGLLIPFQFFNNLLNFKLKVCITSVVSHSDILDETKCNVDSLI